MFLSDLKDGTYYKISKDNQVVKKGYCLHNTILVSRILDLNIKCRKCNQSIFFTILNLIFSGNFYYQYKKSKDIII